MLFFDSDSQQLFLKMAAHFDCVVIGAGVVGSSTAYHLAKRGKNVLLLEQFHLPTVRGSSHGQSRLTRTCYEEKHFASIMPDALAEWKEIERLSGVHIYTNTKVLYLTADDDKFKNAKKNMEQYAPSQFQVVNLSEFLDPQYIRCPDNYKGLIDYTGGALFAQKGVTAMQDLVRKFNGTVRDGCSVKSIDNDGDDVIITTENGTIRSHSLVVCAGTWTSRLFNKQVNQLFQTYLQPLAVRVYYWKLLKQPPTDIPSILDEDSNGGLYPYGIIGSNEYPGLVKVCKHGGVPCNPDERDKAVFEPDLDEKMSNYIKERYPMLEPIPAVMETCMYTQSRDDTFILDKVPTYRNVYVGCGFSGIGFKMAPAVGKLLCEMALGLPPSHDLKPYALSRFDKN